jgi:hypothetical protein
MTPFCWGTCSSPVRPADTTEAHVVGYLVLMGRMPHQAIPMTALRGFRPSCDGHSMMDGTSLSQDDQGCAYEIRSTMQWVRASIEPVETNPKGSEIEPHNRARRHLEMASNRVPPGTHCADPPSTNRSLPVLEPVCECRKRKLKKGDQRRAAETYRLGAASSPFVRRETWVTGPNLRKCRGSYTASPRDDSGWLTKRFPIEPVFALSIPAIREFCGSFA